MSIGVQSYPELYTMLLGWDLYGKLWTLLTQSGIAFIPFIGMILSNVGKTYVVQGHRSSEHAMRQMEVSFIMTLLLIFFGVAPFISLDIHAISYTPACGQDKGSTYYPGETGTTYDKAFALPTNDVRVPLWWYAVISVSEGITNSANTMVGCVPDLRKMITEGDMSNITDPQLVSDLHDFESMCYAPAKLQFFKDGRENNAENLESIKVYTTKYGADDTEWLGSHAFNEVYYKQLNATRPVLGFPYDPSVDINKDSDQQNPPANGTPTCYTWWNDSSNGLKTRLYKTLPDDFQNEFGNYLQDEVTQDNLIKRLLENTPSGYEGYDNANNMIGNVSYSHLASAMGILYDQVGQYPKIYAAAEAAPIIQALILLMIYVFLPFALIFSGYKPGTFIAATFFIFSLIFCGFIWHLIAWTDQALMEALYTNWFAQQGAGAKLTDMIIGTLIIGAPSFWFLFMGSVGVMTGNAVNAISDMNKVGESGASNSANAAKAVVTATQALL